MRNIVTRMLGVCALFLLWACSPVDPANAGKNSAAAPPFQLITNSAVFSDQASTGGVSWADMDADGDLDLFVTNGYDVSAEEPVPQPNRLYENRGQGLLEAISSGPLTEDAGFSSGSTWADMDNDGDLDLFVANQQDQNNFLYRNEGAGVFSRLDDTLPATQGGHSYAASWVDVDADGLVDLWVSNGGMSHAGVNFLYRNLGDGQFSPIANGQLVTEEGATCGASWADYDNDGDQDVFVADLQHSRTGAGGLYRNDGQWQFTKLGQDLVPTGPTAYSAAAWGDVDSDGDLDLYLAAFYGLANTLLLNDGEGGFTRASGRPAVVDGGHAYALGWADYDNDADLDLLVGNWGSGAVLYVNDGAGGLDRSDSSPLGQEVSFAGSLAWADYDGDGDLDPIIGNWPNAPGDGEHNHLFENNAARGHWLQVDLVGAASNRSAIGARITLTAQIGGQERRLLREVTAHSGWRSQNPLRQHFGLSDAETVTTLSVRWPSGQTTSLEAVAANQVLRIEESISPSD